MRSLHELKSSEWLQMCSDVPFRLSSSLHNSPDLSWHLNVALKWGKASSPDFQQTNWARGLTSLPAPQRAPGKPWDTGQTDGAALLAAAPVPAWCLPQRPCRLIILWDNVCGGKAQNQNTNRVAFRWQCLVYFCNATLSTADTSIERTSPSCHLIS